MKIEEISVRWFPRTFYSGFLFLYGSLFLRLGRAAFAKVVKIGLKPRDFHYQFKSQARFKPPRACSAGAGLGLSSENRPWTPRFSLSIQFPSPPIYMSELFQTPRFNPKLYVRKGQTPYLIMIICWPQKKLKTQLYWYGRANIWHCRWKCVTHPWFN